MPRRCWTCQGEHDLDEPCSASMAVRSMRSAGGPGNTLADHTSPDLFDDPDDTPKLGPIFTSRFDGECDACDGAIWAGQNIRAWPGQGYIHADNECERLTRD